MLKLNQTDRLFYGKYPYKIDFDLHGATLIRDRGFEWAKEFALDPNLRDPYQRKAVDRTKLKNFLEVLEPYLQTAEPFQYRIEMGRFTYFSKNVDDIDELSKKLDWCCVAVWKPSDQTQLDFLVSNKRKVLRDMIPYGKYRFKVVLKPSIPASNRAQFVAWVDNYTEDDVKMSKGTRSWLVSGRTFFQHPFFYIADAKMLTFASIFLSNHVSVIYEYVPRHAVILNK
jgi:hypothetical protein